MTLRFLSILAFVAATSAQFAYNPRFLPGRFASRFATPYSTLAPDFSALSATTLEDLPSPTPEIILAADPVDPLVSTTAPDVAIRPRFPFRAVYRRPIFEPLAARTYAPEPFVPATLPPAPVPVFRGPAPRIPAPVPEYEDGPAHYQFQYDVSVPETGDQKSQEESRDNDVVRGSYSVVQPDGLLRIVEYTADDANGFNAIVRYEGLGARHLPIPSPAAII